MPIYKTIHALVLLAGLFAISQTAFAQGRVYDTDTTTAELSMSAHAQTVLTLDISSSNSSFSGTAGTGLFSIDLGNVNGLGVGTPASGVDVAVDSSGATYTTPITLTPVFSGFSSTDATITVSMDGAAGNALGNAAVREGASASVTTVSASSPANVTSTATSGTPIDRYVGFFVSNANGSGNVSGDLSATIVYTITATP